MKTRRRRKRNIWPLSLFSRTTVQHVRRGPKLTSAGRDVYKGHRMYSVGDGSWQVPSIDRESTFDDKRQAKRFIDAWEKRNGKRSMKRNPAYIIVPSGLKARYLESGLPGAARLAKGFKAKDLTEAKDKAERLAAKTGKRYSVYEGDSGRLAVETNPRFPRDKWIPGSIRITKSGKIQAKIRR